MTPAIEIVPFRTRHLERILAIERVCFPREPYTRAMFRSLHCQAGPLFMAAKVRRRIVAYMATCVVGDRAEMVSVAVMPEHRRQGVAGALLTRTLRLLRRCGASALDLMVRADNHAALQFYRRSGFRRAGIDPDYYGRSQPGVRMRLALRKASPAS